VAAEDIDGSSQRRGDRWDEDGEAAVLELLDDEGRHERVLDFCEGGLPDVLAVFSGEALRETAKQRVARQSLEQRRLHPLAEHSAQARPDSDADQEADEQHEAEGKETL